MISSTAKHALPAVFHLGSQHYDFVGRTEIAEATLVRADNLLQVLDKLVAAGLVESRRGPGEGFRRTMSPEEMTALQVVLVEEAFGRPTVAELVPRRKRSRTCDFPKIPTHNWPDSYRTVG